METGSCRVHRQCMWRSNILAEFAFKPRGFRASREPTRLQCVDNFVDFFLPDRGKVERNKRIHAFLCLCVQSPPRATNDGAWQKLERIEFIEFLSGLICESCADGDANKNRWVP